MFVITDAEVLEIAVLGSGMLVRVAVPSPNDERYCFNALTKDPPVCAYLKGLNVGDVITLQGLPYPWWNTGRKRYEMSLEISSNSGAPDG